MIYENILPAVFLDRPNRFIANIEIGNRTEVCHVKNTGRCRELLIPGASIFVQENNLPHRKTRYDLISVYKGKRLVNIDSSAPNRICAEWLQNGGLFQDLALLKTEQRFGNSRFDFYVEGDNCKAYIEVKGVTLEDNGVVRFPDAPTERGVKHLNELAACTKAGFDAYAVFIIQMSEVLYFEPNWSMHQAFGDALKNAARQGVKVLALDCQVAEDSITADKAVEVRL